MTIGMEPTGPDDPLFVGGRRLVDALTAVLRGYDLAESHDTHALRMLRSLFHGFATLQSAGGFRWSTDVDESFEWLVDFVDRGLRAG